MQANNKELLMSSLAKFYSDKTNIERITPIINGKSEVSLRLLDWFVTNYSKKTVTNIVSSNDANALVATSSFNVYLNYRSQLKAYSKQQFDPFRRRDRITFYYEKEDFIETTIGQLNFFRWVIQNKILEYIAENIKAIEFDMFSVQKKNTVDKGKKRIELTKSFVKNMNMFEGTHTICFN